MQQNSGKSGKAEPPITTYIKNSDGGKLMVEQ